MGYILPISQYQYTSYQTRDIKEEAQTENVDKPYKVVLQAEQSKLDNKYKPEKSILEKQDQRTAQAFSANHIDPMLYARLTGKGGIINKVV